MTNDISTVLLSSKGVKLVPNLRSLEPGLVYIHAPSSDRMDLCIARQTQQRRGDVWLSERKYQLEYRQGTFEVVRDFGDRSGMEVFDSMYQEGHLFRADRTSPPFIALQQYLANHLGSSDIGDVVAVTTGVKVVGSVGQLETGKLYIDVSDQRRIRAAVARELNKGRDILLNRSVFQFDMKPNGPDVYGYYPDSALITYPDAIQAGNLFVQPLQ